MARCAYSGAQIPAPWRLILEITFGRMSSADAAHPDLPWGVRTKEAEVRAPAAKGAFSQYVTVVHEAIAQVCLLSDSRTSNTNPPLWGATSCCLPFLPVRPPLLFRRPDTFSCHHLFLYPLLVAPALAVSRFFLKRCWH